MTSVIQIRSGCRSLCPCTWRRVAQMVPFYIMRAVGGMFFFAGMIVMTYNMYRTISRATHEEAALEARLAAKLARAGA